MADEGSIERLKKKLYSRTEDVGPRERRKMREFAYPEVVSEYEPQAPVEKKPMNTHKLLTTLLIAAVVFFVGSIALSAFFFFADRNTVSPQNISIEIQGPATIGGGEELILQIVITNNNAVALEEADLLIEYPEGTRAPNNISQEQTRTREALGSIAPGERVQKTARAVLFGEEGSSKVIKLTIEYRVRDSNAIFYREQSYEITLSNAPLTLSVDSVDEISSGQPIEFEVIVGSNSEKVLEDITLVAEYPFGFEFTDASPKPYAKTNVWKIGDLKPESAQTITIRGRVIGEDEEERVFRFSAGVPGAIDDTKLETVFVSTLQPISVERPFIGATLAINGSTNENPVVNRSDRIRADITWSNNLSDRIFDGEVEVKLNGSIIDESSVVAQRGFYRSSDNTVVFSRETDASLATLDAGSQGTVSFTFSPQVFRQGEGFRTPAINLDVTVRGKRVSERNVPQTVESTIRRTIKVASDTGLSSRVSYTSGPFANSGPVPPRAEQETTYTVFFTVTNSTNPLGDVTVEAALPPYVRWVGAVNPSNESVEYNSVGGRVRWNVGNLASYAGRTLAFQVVLEPSISQVGSTPVLVNDQLIEGIDTFTTTRISATAPALTTELSDPGYSSQSGRVTQ